MSSTQSNVENRDKFAVMYVSSWWKVGGLTRLIDDETGFKSPYIRICMKKGRVTGQAFAVVPESCVEKLECLDVKGVRFKRAAFHHVEMDENHRGLYLIRPRDGIGAMRRVVLDVIYQLHQFGLLDKNKCFLSRHNRLFVNSSLEECQIAHAFINGAPYEYRGNIEYVRAPYLRSREASNEDAEMEHEVEEVHITNPGKYEPRKVSKEDLM